MEQSIILTLPEVLASATFRQPFLQAYVDLFTETGEG